MKPLITFVYSYYKNAGMFKIQQMNWISYPREIRDRIEFIVTDDCSQVTPARDNIISNNKIDMSVYEIQKKVQWNWLECRNIGAHHARGQWILLTDMDHLVTAEVAAHLIRRIDMGLITSKFVYQFSRVKAPNFTPYKFHNDSFFLSRKMFWASGGYDEYLAGHYGTSGIFRERLMSVANDRKKKFDDLYLVLYGREVQPDASTVDFARKEGRDPYAVRKLVQQKKDRGDESILLFQQPYRRIK